MENPVRNAANLRQRGKNRLLEGEGTHKKAAIHRGRYRDLMAITRAVTLCELYDHYQMAAKALEEELVLPEQAKILEQEAVKANKEADEILNLLETPAGPLQLNFSTSRETTSLNREDEPPALPVLRAQESKGLLEKADKMNKEADRTLHRASTMKTKTKVFRFGPLKSMRRNAENELAEGEVLKDTALELWREAKRLQRDAIVLAEANMDKPENASVRDFESRSEGKRRATDDGHR